MSFTPVITNEGAAYLAAIIANEGNVDIKSVKYSSTNYSGSEAALTAATFGGVFKTDASPSASVKDSTTISIATSCDNVGITVATNIYSIGIIANNSGTDVLLCVCTTTTPDIINPFALTASYIHYVINIAVSSTASITVSGSVAGALYISDIENSLTSTATNKPLSAAMGKSLNDGKVDKVSGKGLSTEDFTSAEKTKLSGIATGATKNTVSNSLSNTSTTDALSAAMGKSLNDNKVDKVTGKGLSTEDFTTAEQTKLAGIASGATANTVATYTATIPTISGTSANVTVSGILASDNPIVDINWSGSETTTQRDNILEAWGCVYRISTSANKITVYVTDATTVTIPIQLKVIR